MYFVTDPLLDAALGEALKKAMQPGLGRIITGMDYKNEETKPDGKHVGRNFRKAPAKYFDIPGQGLKKEKDYQLNKIMDIMDKILVTK